MESPQGRSGALARYAEDCEYPRPRISQSGEWAMHGCSGASVLAQSTAEPRRGGSAVSPGQAQCSPGYAIHCVRSRLQPAAGCLPFGYFRLVRKACRPYGTRLRIAAHTQRLRAGLITFTLRALAKAKCQMPSAKNQEQNAASQMPTPIVKSRLQPATRTAVHARHTRLRARNAIRSTPGER
jgi:hypothetical protein